MKVFAGPALNRRLSVLSRTMKQKAAGAPAALLLRAWKDFFYMGYNLDVSGPEGSHSSTAAYAQGRATVGNTQSFHFII